MKHIKKGPEPAAFTAWKARANEDWQPTYGGLGNPEKHSVLVALSAEQGGLCCYCERRLGERKDRHIEHLVPRHLGTVDPLDYGNMLCSCQGSLSRKEPRHCGASKGEWYDAALFLSPLDSDCESRFAWMGDGAIQPAESFDVGAKETIRRLSLDIAKLRDLRRKVIEPFLDAELEPAEFNQFVTAYLAPDDQGGFSEFHTTIAYLFRSP